MNVIIAIGMSPEVVVQEFSHIAGVTAPELMKEIDPQSALVWMRDSREVHYMHLVRPTAERQRHKRKYAAGELGEDRSFYFRGAEGQLNLRAQNLMLFLQLAEGVDDQTWEFHLRRGDYSSWLRDALKDGELAEEVRYVEQNMAFDPRLSRERIRHAIQQRYTAPP